MKRLTLDFFVGIFVLIGAVCITFLSLKVAGISAFTDNSKDAYTLYAEFSNIGSLKIDAPIKVSGFVVGRVYNIYLDPKTYQAKVVMKINRNYQFSTDSSAQILTTGLLGEQYIEIQQGADVNYLVNNDTITITSSAMVLENLIAKFMTNLGNK